MLAVSILLLEMVRQPNRNRINGEAFAETPMTRNGRGLAVSMLSDAIDFHFYLLINLLSVCFQLKYNTVLSMSRLNYCIVIT